MITTQCPKCKKDVSDKATFCQNCGYRLPEEQKLYRIWITELKPDNEDLINFIKDIKNIDFLEAKNLENNVPFTLINDLTQETAQNYLKDLMEFGAVAEIIEQSKINKQNKKFYRIIMLSANSSNRDLTKLVQDMRDIDFLEAKLILEKTPFVISNNLGFEVAKNYCSRIINLGGIAEVEEQEDYDKNNDLTIKAMSNGSFNNSEGSDESKFIKVFFAIVIAIIILSFL